MPPGGRSSWSPGALIAGAVLAVAVLMGLGALLKLGPFAEEPLYEHQFTARVDEICRDAHARFRELQQSPPETAVQAQALTERLIGIADDEYNQIAQLEPPDALADAVHAYPQSRREGIDLMHEGLDAARSNDGVAYRHAQAALDAGQPDRERAAKALGLRVCSAPLNASAG
jgi:hypothetical protein